MAKILPEMVVKWSFMRDIYFETVFMQYASVATETSQISIQQRQHDWHNSQGCKMHQSGLVKSKASKGGLISE